MLDANSCTVYNLISVRNFVLFVLEASKKMLQVSVDESPATAATEAAVVDLRTSVRMSY